MPSDKLSKSSSESELSNLDLDKRFPLEAEISPHNQDVLLQIASLIRLAEGFRLGFVKCNQPIQRRLLAARLKAMLAGEAKILEVELTGSTKSLRTTVLEELKNNESSKAGKIAIIVYGFERSVSQEGLTPALEELNLSRELFSRDFPCPFLLWLPDYALTRLAREAPDFWGWRSGVFEFQPDLKLISTVEKMALQDSGTASLSLSEKRDRVAALEGLIRDYAELQRGEREDLALTAVLQRLGSIRYQLGDYDKAQRLYQDSLKIAQDRGNKSGVSVLLNLLGNLALYTGDLAEARRLYQESLKIEQELGEKRGVAGTIHQLGILAHDTGDLAETRRLYQESLKIRQELDDKRGVAQTLHQLGNLALDTGNLVEASRLYQESLKIEQELGDKSSLAQTLHQLGTLAYGTDDLAEARRLYQESLKIEQELGEKRGVAGTLHQLGNLAYATDDLAEARRLYQESLKIKEELGDKSGVAITSAQSALLEEKEGNLDGALQLIRRAESLFLEMNNPMVSQARKDRERLEKKRLEK